MINLDNPKQSKQVVLFAGDIHGNKEHAKWVIDEAARNNCTHIIACGDFGFWTHLHRGRVFVDFVAKKSQEKQIKFLWIDGNHENHDLIRDLVDKHGSDKPIDTPNEWLQYIPRGCRFTIGAVSYMGYGGAYSVDWKDRVEGKSWWRGELIDPFHLDGIADQFVDVLITHDAPYNGGKWITYKDDLPVSVAQRQLVKELHNKVRPVYHFCGHHHVRETWMDGDTEVHVLGRDTMGNDSICIFDSSLSVVDDEVAVI